MLVDPRHFHLLKTPKRCHGIHGCHPPVTAMVWFNAWPTLRSDRSHLVYTGYMGNSSPKKIGEFKIPMRKEEYYPHMQPKDLFFEYSSVLRLIMTSSQKRGISQASLDSKISSLEHLWRLAHLQSTAVISFARLMCTGVVKYYQVPKKSLGGTQNPAV